MSFMLAVRFLADHLQGDVYFKVASRGDNLLRARSQLRLARRFRQAAPAFASALEKALREAMRVPRRDTNVPTHGVAS